MPKLVSHVPNNKVTGRVSSSKSWAPLYCWQSTSMALGQFGRSLVSLANFTRSSSTNHRQQTSEQQQQQQQLGAFIFVFFLNYNINLLPASLIWIFESRHPSPNGSLSIRLAFFWDFLYTLKFRAPNRSDSMVELLSSSIWPALHSIQINRCCLVCCLLVQSLFAGAVVVCWCFCCLLVLSLVFVGVHWCLQCSQLAELARTVPLVKANSMNLSAQQRQDWCCGHRITVYLST